ncbi:MAG: TonB-dependent receptor [Candidatus Didemnitutus sp.]|nr:TonB-dependent receptor [Candidatus Didemnitutus sp.]
MRYPSSSQSAGFSFRLFFRPIALFLALFALNGTALAADTGRLTGTVSSQGTRNMLQGALVTLSDLNRSALTDNTGRFVLYDVPAGAVNVVVSYAGFKDQPQSAVVTAGSMAELSFELQASDVVMLDKFTVTSVKEGQALSVTEQRNASNIKTVVALDEWGVLPTQNVGELFSRMPGISFTTDEDNLINNISIRGQPSSFTRLNIDGMSSTGVGGDGRTATLHSFSGSMYEQLEVILGQMPDRRADSLGGQINLKTKSPLAMTEKRRIGYNLGGRWFPPFASDRNVSLADNPLNPDLSASYQEIFDLFGGKRNFGLALNASYQSVVNPIDYDFLQYENTMNPVANFRDYDKRSGVNERVIYAFNARADWRLSDSTTASLRFLYNAGAEPHYDRARVNPFGGNSVVATLDAFGLPTGTGAILPGYTANRTEIRPVTGSRMALETWNFSFMSWNPTGTLAFDHDLGRLKVDHAYRWSNTRWHSGHGREGQGGQLVTRTRDPIGFALDSTDLNGVVFTQLSGPSVYAPASYTPFVVTNANTTTIPVAQTSTLFVKRDTVTRTNEVSATANARYDFETAIPLTIKVGVDTVNRRVNNFQVSPRRWYGVVGSVLTADMMAVTEFEQQHGGTRLPIFSPTAVTSTLSNSALWYEDVNFNATSPYTTRRIMEEGVDAAYVQSETKLGKLNILSGVRIEWVTTDNFTYFRARSTPIATEPDHYKRAALDFQRQTTNGGFRKAFPSVHLTYDIMPNLKARVSWSTSYGRATLAQLVPSVTANDTTQTVTIGNPSIRPQTADNIDVKLEYYFKGNGQVSISAFRKEIKDYIASSTGSGFTVPSGPDNGFEGLYSGYLISRPSNVGDAEVEGFEFNYSQRLTFLPGLLKGLTLSANYTEIETKGKFAGTTELRTNQVAGFVPRTLNARVQYAYKDFGASFDANYTGEHILGLNLTSPGLSFYRRDLTTYNAGVTYRIRPEATLFLAVNNLTEAAPEHYVGIESRTRQLLISPLAIKFGVTGQF